MKKIRAAIVGYGNIGHFTLEALQVAPDFEIAGIVRRHGAENKPAELEPYPVVKSIKELSDVDVAEEMTVFVRNQVQMHSASAIFTQANAFPHMILQLLEQ